MEKEKTVSLLFVKAHESCLLMRLEMCPMSFHALSFLHPRLYNCHVTTRRFTSHFYLFANLG